MRRNVNLLRLFGNIYIVVILCYIALSYYVFMYKDTLQMPNSNPSHQSLFFNIPIETSWTYIHIVAMHTLIFMLLFSFLQTIISDPGKVPLFWVTILNISNFLNLSTGLFLGWPRPQEKKILFDLPHFQAWEKSPLLSLQQMRA